MPALVPFDTIPQLFRGLSRHYDGRRRAVMAYKDKKTKAWVDITHEELRDRVEAFAGFLWARGVRKGDRVALLSENRPEWAVTDLATQLLGAVNVSLYTTLPPSQIGYILKDSGSKILVVSSAMQLRKAEEVFDACPDLALIVTMSELKREHARSVIEWDAALTEGAAAWREHVGEIAPLADAVRPDDLSALIYTSGTTGLPKGVMLTHRNLCSNASAALDYFNFGEEDIHLSFLPLCHSFERTAGYTVMLAAGAKIAFAESVDAVSKNLPEVRPTVLISVPRLYERVYASIQKSVDEGPPFKKRLFEWGLGVGRRVAKRRAEGRAPGPFLRAESALAQRLVFAKLHEKLGGHLRFGVSGGAALPRHIGEFFEGTGLTIVEGYGLTETSPVLCFNPMDAPRFGMAGQVMAGVTIGIQQNGAIIAEQRGDAYPSALSSGEGEIVAKGPNIMKGYWNAPDATKEAIDADGWYHTGDVGRFVDGYLQITDRIKHMIVNKGGKNIYPGPIEDDLKRRSTLFDQVVVIGEGREYLTALVVPGVEAAATLTGAATDADATAHPAVKEEISRLLREYSKGAASHEKVRDVRVLQEPFTIENELMTPKMSLKRKAIEKHYAAVIDEMYAGKDAEPEG